MSNTLESRHEQSSVTSTLFKGAILKEEESLKSNNEKYFAKLQSDFNFVVYMVFTLSSIVWLDFSFTRKCHFDQLEITIIR